MDNAIRDQFSFIKKKREGAKTASETQVNKMKGPDGKHRKNSSF